ncbi:hypothetical protein [Brevibacillus brevis]|uniref:hypothetical protein n=1 Tax=Brevibacillus brevis TaxID=1393 RepID=UPI000D10F2AB|nr:hypothetical protein [Brevibacillus brevis]PSJ69609.1 hypothetical protein C7J99_09375 [Brevibacillus brevis]RED23142.1 hypothetical protein DES34_115116 [Brevibacillus brevis]GEC89597.1 hypothetical protein BBR01nite_19280 [Brevibacillus brevis]VEF87524.1 Uncharacterised protein [Brevibacillus brevis]
MTRTFPVFARIILGLILLGAGVNGYMVLFGFEPIFPTSPAAMELLQGYLLVLVKTVEIICGLLFLTNRFVPLALTATAPLAVNILTFHLFVDPDMLVMGLIIAVLEVYLLWSYRRSFRQLMTM